MATTILPSTSPAASSSVISIHDFEYDTLDPSEIERLSMEEKRRERRAAIELAHEREMEAIHAISRAEQEERERIEAAAAVDEERWQQEELAAMANFRAALEEKRRIRQEDDAIHDEKVMQAVLQASLMEFNARGQIENLAGEEDLFRQFESDKALRNMERQKALAHADKFNKVQMVLDTKKRAHAAKESARLAIEEYQAKERLRRELLWQQEEDESVRLHIEQLAAVRKRQDEAVVKRVEAERRAEEAMSRAKELRQKALVAAKLVRQTSRQAIEKVLQQEEVVRSEDYRRQMEALDKDKEIASRVRHEKEMVAKEKLEHAIHLREKALDAAHNKLASLSLSLDGDSWSRQPKP
ncbi:hypothetical protein DYB34_003894 [Aphanomyces astaci]|uniref:Uncharacterized protein n=1 Tax=Aphanomyces astaci TaxID=112090 RepID=A0A3R6VVC3_APHAT|nr:hypothetical protein DYB34_003894 [Aphanomyces astaci]